MSVSLSGRAFAYSPKCGRGIGVAEPCLGGDDISSGHEEGGHVVAELVEGCCDSCVVAEPFEAVAEGACGEPVVVFGVWAEHPWSQLAGCSSLPCTGECVPQPSGGGSEGERSGSS